MPQSERTFERRRLRVYVAGPISSDVFEGVYRGFAMGKRMFLDGLAPFIPHADAYWFLGGEVPGDQLWKSYLEYDLEYVSVCDAVFRLEGPSKGADLEVEVAKSLGIPVFYEASDKLPGAFDTCYQALLNMAAEMDLNGVRV